MGENEKLLERARDELFSHINRCGVLQAAAADQRQWMDETIDYVAERYPDLSDSQLTELYNVGIRFCQPAIPHGSSGSPGDQEADAGESDASSEDDGAEASEPEAVSESEEEAEAGEADKEDANAA